MQGLIKLCGLQFYWDLTNITVKFPSLVSERLAFLMHLHIKVMDSRILTLTGLNSTVSMVVVQIATSIKCIVFSKPQTYSIFANFKICYRLQHIMKSTKVQTLGTI